MYNTGSAVISGVLTRSVNFGSLVSSSGSVPEIGSPSKEICSRCTNFANNGSVPERRLALFLFAFMMMWVRLTNLDISGGKVPSSHTLVEIVVVDAGNNGIISEQFNAAAGSDLRSPRRRRSSGARKPAVRRTGGRERADI
jgi:hypothetical protein